MKVIVDKKIIITAVVARLKSRRLFKKALKPFLNDVLIVDLMERVSQAERTSQTILATSYLEGDNELCDIIGKKNYMVYRGDPNSVIDRLIELAEEYKADAIFRITGDNPFTDPQLMDLMADLLIDHDLDYVRANNLPIGVSGELYATNYLKRLHTTMDDPNKSEYLSWYVIQDMKGKKGCIDIKSEIMDLNCYGLTVDYKEDYNRCLKLLKKIGKSKISEITLSDLISNICFLEKIDKNNAIKLPDNKKLKYTDYLKMVDGVDYAIRNEVIV